MLHMCVSICNMATRWANVRVHAEIHDRMKAAAERDGRSLSSWRWR